MVSVFLLALFSQSVVSHAAFIINVEEDSSIKRELQEGNFGLKIEQNADAGKDTTSQENQENKKEISEEPPEKETSSEAPVGKISDALSTQDISLPATIQSHLYSPVQIYQPRFESAPRFEISAPIPAHLAYSDTMYQISNSIQDHFRLLNQLQPRFNPFLSITPPQQDLSPLTSWSPQIYQRLFPSIPGVDPRSIYHEINHLEHSNDDIFNGNLGGDDDGSKNATASEPKTNLNSTQTNVEPNQVNQNSSAFSQPQPAAVSFVSFTQKLPTTSPQSISEQPTLKTTSFPPLSLPPLPSLPAIRPLPPLPPLPQFRAFPTLPPLSSPPPLTPSTLLPPLPTGSPASTPFVSRPIGVIRIRQQTTPAPPLQQGFASSPLTFRPPSTSQAPTFFKTTSNIVHSPTTAWPPTLYNLQNQRVFSLKPTSPPAFPFSTTRQYFTTFFPQPSYPLLRTQPAASPYVSTLSPATFRPLQSSQTPPPQTTRDDSPPSERVPVIPTLPPLPALQPYLNPWKQNATKSETNPPVQSQDIDSESNLPTEPVETQQELNKTETSSPVDPPRPESVVKTELVSSELPLQVRPDAQDKTPQIKTNIEGKSNEKSEKANTKSPASEPKDLLFAQLVHNSFYPENPGTFLQPPFLGLAAVPTIPSFINDPSYILFSDPNSSVIQSHVPTFQGPTAVAALQYYGPFAPHIFGQYR